MTKVVRALLSMAALGCAGGCAAPRLPAELPPREEAWVAVLSGETPVPIEQLARHSWIVMSVPGEASYRRWELERRAFRDFTNEPYRYLAEGDVAVHGVVSLGAGQADGGVEKALAMARCLDREVDAYNRRHPVYTPIPGPNSNTFVAEAMRACGIHVELPATAIGRDYRGPVGAGVTESGTGVQAESVAAGVRLGLREGVEAHVFALALGVHAWPPGITVPVNPGRIGVDLDGHATVDQLGRDDARVRDVVDAREWADPIHDARPRRLGVATAQIFAKAAHVKRPDDAGGLAERVTVGLTGRAVLGRRHLGYAFGSDLELGMGLPAGFAWEAFVYPAGIGWMFGPTGYVALFGGAGGSGVTARVPGAVVFPIEARLEVDAGPYARLGLRGAVAWAPFEEARRGGSVTSFADELSTSAFVRFGKTRRRAYGTAGQGFFFALERREVMRSFTLSLSFGAEIDFGG